MKSPFPKDSLIKPPNPSERNYLFDSQFYTFKDGRGIGLVYQDYSKHYHIGYFDSEGMFYRCLERNYRESEGQRYIPNQSPFLYSLTCPPNRELAKQILDQRPQLEGIKQAVA